MHEGDNSFWFRFLKSLKHLLRCDVQSFRIMESPFVDKDDFSSPVAQLKFVVLTERFLVGCVVRIAILSVNGTCDLKGSVDSLLLCLSSLRGNLRADILPCLAVPS